MSETNKYFLTPKQVKLITNVSDVSLWDTRIGKYWEVRLRIKGEPLSRKFRFNSPIDAEFFRKNIANAPEEKGEQIKSVQEGLFKT